MIGLPTAGVIRILSCLFYCVWSFDSESFR